MVGIGTALIGLSLVGVYFRWNAERSSRSGWLLWVFMLAVPLPYLANQLGWVTAEVGRQPWVVYGLLRTSDALSKAVVANQILGSIIMFIVIYALLFAIFIFVLDSKIRHGPEEPLPHPVTGGGAGRTLEHSRPTHRRSLLAADCHLTGGGITI